MGWSHSGRSRSYWERTERVPRRPPLDADADTDVCIVGAGIAGLTTAYMLARKGVRVIVLEAGEIGGGQTGRTTAHLTSALDDRMYLLEAQFGEKDARLAAESHAAAIDAIEHIAELEEIDCDFRRLDGYLFIPPEHADEGPELIEREYKAAKRAKLSVVREPRVPLDRYDTGMCLRFKGQAEFHPLKYLKGLAEAAESAGARICCGTRVTGVKGGSEARVTTEDGKTVNADAVVVATNSPVNDRVTVHTKQASYRTYVVAMIAPRGEIERALYWDGFWKDDDLAYHYVRLADGPVPREDGPEGEPAFDVLIVGGEDHKTGQPGERGGAEQRYERLIEWARVHFPKAGDVAWRWSGQVMEPADMLGFIGRNPFSSENVYIATGDSGNGMTHGTIAGMLLTDLIRGCKNPWAGLYAPTRSVAGAAGEYWSENLNVAGRYGEWFGGGDVDSADKVAPGTGAVLRRGLRKVAVYRDENGKVTELSAACTHLGCIVHWNNGEKCWDCPCHGSHFAPTGEPINGPAHKPLKLLKGERAEKDAVTHRENDEQEHERKHEHGREERRREVPAAPGRLSDPERARAGRYEEFPPDLRTDVPGEPAITREEPRAAQEGGSQGGESPQDRR